jgi:hypothetical protein
MGQRSPHTDDQADSDHARKLSIWRHFESIESVRSLLGRLDHCLNAASGHCSSKMDSAAESPEPSPTCYLLITKKCTQRANWNTACKRCQPGGLSNAILPKKSLLHDS